MNPFVQTIHIPWSTNLIAYSYATRIIIISVSTLEINAVDRQSYKPNKYSTLTWTQFFKKFLNP